VNGVDSEFLLKNVKEGFLATWIKITAGAGRFVAARRGMDTAFPCVGGRFVAKVK
jgi:hypothetical protein